MTPADSNISQIIEILLDQILLNADNPRGGINWEYVDVLSVSMATDGQKTAIKVRPDNGKYRNVGGDHRVLAARKLGWKTIKAIVLDITPEEAILEGHLDNQGQPKTWFSDYKAVEAAHTLYPQMPQGDIAAKVMVNRQYVNRALQLMPLLNAGARGAICLNQTGKGKYKVPETGVFRLIDLSTGQPGDLDQIASALTVVIDRQMTETEVKKLVEWVKAGNLPQTYAPAPKTPKPKAVTTLHPDEVIAKVVKLTRQATLEETHGDSETTHRDGLKAYLAEIKQQASTIPPVKADHHTTALNYTAPASKTQTGPNLFLDWLAGISIFSQLKSKVKKGGQLSFADYFLMISQWLGWLGKHGFKYIGRAIKFVWKTLTDALKILGVLSFVKTVLTIAFFLVAAWLGWEIYHYGFFHPFKVIEYKFLYKKVENKTAQEAPASVSTPVQSVPVAETKPKTPIVKKPLVPKPASIAISANTGIGTTNPTPTSTTTIAQATPTVAKTDIAGQALKQIAPDVAGDLAKKLFNF